VQGLDPRDVGVAHAHADRGKINKQSVDAAVQVTLDLGGEISVSRRRGADPQVFGQEFIFGAEGPHMHLEIERMRRLDARPVPTRAGDTVFFDSYTPHASGPNLTAERRRVLYITYNRRSAGDHRARYYADKRKSFPPDIERDPARTYTFRV
jgi:hypothetical protein